MFPANASTRLNRRDFLRVGGLGLDRVDVSEHADLDRVDADVARHGPDLREYHLGRDVVDRGDPNRVLRGDRGDRRHPVDAAGGKGLEVGLDPGTAARV